ncbi:hypothetical protein B0O99DRAFT_635693 [Bisporella sp. PMI_857]|nr:hypothetical protein B0O99DRAFT_635693 [Bisporella sp. PMI_857]
MNHSRLFSRVLSSPHRSLLPPSCPYSFSYRSLKMSTASPVPSGHPKPRYVEIGINLTDPVYIGHYNGKERHPNDLSDVVQRAREVGCEKLIVTASDLHESYKAIELSKVYPETIYNTVGVHPCCCRRITSDSVYKTAQEYLAQLKDLAILAKQSGQCIAFGEFGLDYDRLELCDKETQLEFFAKQLDIAVEVDLPLFLHSRAAHEDFARLLREKLDKLPKRGVVHSFTGTEAEMLELVGMGFDIGINGCSLKTEENLAVAKAVPLERLQLETDGPWCEMRPGHASARFWKGSDEERWKSVKKEKWVQGAMIKGRNEPCMIERVAKAVAGIKEVDVEVVTEAVWANSVRMFGLGLSK